MHQRLASFYASRSDAAKASAHADASLRVAREIYPPDHPGLATALNAQVEALIVEGRYEEAAVVGEERLRLLRKSGRETELAHPLNTLGILYLATGQIDLSVARCEEAVAIRVRAFGGENPRIAEMRLNLARSLAAAGAFERADSCFRAVIAVYDRLDPRSPYNAHAYGSYANLCRDRGRLARADSLYARAEALIDTTDAGLRPTYGEYLAEHGYLRSLQGRHGEADSMIATGVRLRARESDQEHRDLGPLFVLWAAARARAGDAEGASTRLRRAKELGAAAREIARYPALASIR